MTDETIIKAVAAELADGSAQPLYRKMVAAIEKLIAAGMLKRGALLPSERELEGRLGVSRVTVRKALDVLIVEGVIRRRQGSRTEVTARVEKSLARLSSFSEDMESRGFSPGCLWISKEIAFPTPSEAMALGLGPNASILRLRRVRTADGVPIAIETAAVPVSILGDPALVGDSLYAALDAVGVLPRRAVQRMQAGPADALDKTHLALADNASLLIVERRCFHGDRVVEFTQTRYRGDVYDFVLELHR
ncbi:GntR family transcriptional regulator [Pelagibacterium luteolum]|uniref:GntR family transcriptional regulator n=1 Tax=Pelagibacterium luteolum TaxID=440168 RepID=A0A1G7YZ66_9HYPH|nr:GntR family transcriptional regulator [Pelagibacterium luteolum]SDH01576.1 GntR family transcriptional regulator [Pelagibacterium luteolum]